MTQNLPEGWPTLDGKFPEGLIEQVAAILQERGHVVIEVDDLTAESTYSAAEAEALLKELARKDVLITSTTHRCGHCDEAIDEDTMEIGRCPICDTSLEEVPPVTKTVYSRPGPRSRDVQWVVTIHGMNTHGRWQQEFSWELSQVYGYSVPVAIYKYGRIFISPLLQYRQWTYRDQLVVELQRLRQKRAEQSRVGPPDVICHSFGTGLLAQALLKDESLVVGRVILTGSLVRPDFDWKALIDARRVEAVLCHSGGRDRWVRVAQFGIPLSGPSGYRGFDDRGSAVHVHERRFSHSDFFDEENLIRNLHGVWASFLTVPLSATEGLNSPPPQQAPWRPSRLRKPAQVLKVLLMVAATALIGLIAIALVLGARDLSSYARHLMLP
jgi:hypothetical protein